MDSGNNKLTSYFTQFVFKVKMHIMANTCWFFSDICKKWTLILPGEVKVDLADFDIKLRKNLCALFKKKYLFLQKPPVTLVLLYTQRQKMK